MKNNKLLIWILFCVGALAIAGFLGIFYWRGSQITASDYQPQTLLVFLSKPLNSSTVHVGDTLPVTAEANGSVPVESLEFWIDGKLVDSVKAMNPVLKQLNGTWDWTPEKEGRITLMVRAMDSSGQSVLSNPVVINVLPAEPVVLKVVPKSGDTINSLIKELNISADAAEGLNSGIGLDDPLKENEPVELAIPAEKFTSSSSSTEETNTLELVELVPTLKPTQNPGGDKSSPPLAPSLDLEVDGCNINIKVTAKSDNADIFKLYIMRHDSNQFAFIMEQGPMVTGSSFTYVEKDAFGDYKIGAVAQNGAGIASTIPASIQVSSEECTVNAKQPVDVKVISRDLISRLYCYATIDEKTYIHIPNSADSYMTPMSSTALEEWGKKVFPYGQLKARSGFDISAHLPVIYPKGNATSHIKFECWDWDTQFNMGVVEKDMTDAEMKTYVMLSNSNYDVVGIFGTNPYDNANHIQISAPYNFKSTGNPVECGKHGPASEYQNCENMIKVGMAAYVWDYQKQTCFPGTEAFCQYVDIDGFRIYRNYKTGEPPQWSYGVAGKDKVTAGFTQWPSLADCNQPDMLMKMVCAVANMPCYTVRAYKGSLESRDSNEVCLGPQEMGTGTKTINLPPTLMGVGGMVYFLNKSAQSEYAANTDDYIEISHDGNFDVGHIYSNNDGGWGNKPSKDSRDYYGFIKFGELQEIMGKPIQSARLKFRMGDTFHKIDGWVNYTDDCAQWLSISKDAPYFYLKSTPLKRVKLANMPDSITAEELQFDVTDIVKAWSQGQVNHGFVLDGTSNTPLMQDFEWCRTNFNSFSLEVTYFPNP